MIIKRIQAGAVVLFLGAVSAAMTAGAQAPVAAPPPAASAVSAAPVAPPSTTPAPLAADAVLVPAVAAAEDINAVFKASFFLSEDEISRIKDAMKGNHGKPLVEAPVETKTDEEPAPAIIIPTYRVISISGVLYRTAQDWVVWMNGQKVTPKKLLPEIVKIDVKDSSKVHLEWYDIGLDKVISITLRPHQTYDIPTGILLPGSE